MASAVRAPLPFRGVAATAVPSCTSHPFRRLLTAAVAVAMVFSAAAGQSAATVGRDAVAAPAVVAAPAASVAIDGSGAVYVLREDDTLHFWIVDETAMTVQRKASVAIDPLSSDIVAVELGAEVTALFYADNLRNDGDQYRLSFRSTATLGKIALPRLHKALVPLNQVSLPEEIVAIAPHQVELLALAESQRAIFERVATVVQTQAEQVELFRVEAGQELAAFYALQRDHAPRGQALLDEAQASAQARHDHFIARVNADLTVLQDSAAAVTATVGAAMARYEGPVIQCLNGEAAKLDDQLKRLEQTLSAIQSDDPEVSTYDAQIEATEAAVAQSEVRLAACADPGELENYSPNVDIDQNAAEYQSIAAAAQALIDDLEPRIDAWQLELEAAGQAAGDRIASWSIGTDAETLRYAFDEWISPSYAIEEALAEAVQTPAQDRGADDKALTEPAKAGAQKETTKGLKSTEVLCDGETWNMEFLGDFSVVFGTPFNDQVVTGEQANIVATLAGDDCVESHAGADTVLAGTGHDRVYAGDHHDIVLGGAGKDEIHGGAGRRIEVIGNTDTLEIDLGNLLIGQSGDDRIFGGEVAADRGEDGEVDEYGYADVVVGDGLMDSVLPGHDYIDGEMGIDFLLGRGGNDQMLNLVPGVLHIAGVEIPLGSYFSGGDGNDSIAGSDTANGAAATVLGDLILGDAGDDTVAAGAGIDVILGGDGNDGTDAGAGMDFTFGQNGNDYATGSDGPDLVVGKLGDDSLRGGAGLIDAIFGGEGDDKLYGDDGLDLISGRAGVDTIQGGSGIDLIAGEGDGDVIDGNADTDLVLGGPGEDRINGGGGLDLLLGMTESDVVRGGDATDVIIGGDNTGKDPEYLYGEIGIDLVFGLGGPDVIEGGFDLDFLAGNEGNDMISGGFGTDFAFGGLHDDTINGNDGLDILIGGVIQPSFRVSDKDTIDGGTGTDLILGTTDCDTITGGDGADLIGGGGSKDRIVGGNGVDVIFGGKQQDHIQGGASTDFLFGGDDHDYLSGDDEMDAIFGGGERDHVFGGSGRDIVFTGDDHDYANGGAGGDLLFGGVGYDVIEGGDDNDLLFGGVGDDNLNGGGGNDRSFGGADADKLREVEGQNYAFGGAGNDKLDGYSPGTPDPLEILFGGPGDDDLVGNSSNQKDLKFGGPGNDDLATNQTIVTVDMFNASWLGNLVCDM